MFCIAVCDDEEIFCTEIESYLKSYFKDNQVDIKIFYSGEALYEAMASGQNFDLIFLDIMLKTLGGVEIGLKIRNELKDERTNIVFVSAETEYAMQLFEIRPLNFLIKPVTQKQVIDVVNKAMCLSTINDSSYGFRIGKEYCKCYYSDILFFESKARQIILHTLTRDYVFYGKLNEIEQETSDYFLRIHQSYLVNPLHIERYNPDKVTMVDGKVLSISKACQKTVRQSILRRWRMD